MSSLDPESWKSISPHLDRALDLPEDERAAWLKSLSDEDPTMAAHLREMLDEHRMLAQERFMEQSPSSGPAGPAAQGGTIGSYRLLAVIGEGGMGTVWLAERSDGEFQQKVAIKLLRPGADRPSLKHRFLKERQFLANLNHASVARLLDAGETNDGRPYLIMEYVDGVPIDVYTAPLDTSDCITLFLKVCEGVAHAHNRLIVHRDLKPSNILVDSNGQPKLLDFGIAKLLDDSGNATRTIERALTPNYASPEQFHGQPQTIATDIYSLGAVLYKLLTGRSPHETGAEPTPVPAVLTGGREITSPTRLKANLPKDIDYILGKALRTEPDERYVSVDAFSDDLRALLDWRPVQARSGDRWYRTRKFLRRHWIPVAAASVMMAGLAVGLYVANRERTVAQRRFAQVRQLANRVLSLDMELRSLPGAVRARQEIVSMSLEYLEALRPEARADQRLAMEIATTYSRLARAQGVPVSLNLGQYEQAEESLRKAEDLIESILAASPSHWAATSASIQIAHDRMILADSRGKPDEALAQARKAVARSEAFLAMDNIKPLDRSRITEVYVNVALAHKNQHRYEDAVRYASSAVQQLEAGPADLSTLSNAWSIVADARRAMGDLTGSLQAIVKARSAVERDDPNAYLHWSYLFNVLWREGLVRGAANGPSLGQTAEATAVFQQAIDVLEREAAKDPNEAASRMRFASAGRELGAVLRDRSPERALAVYDLAIARLGQVQKNARARRGEAELLAGSSYALRKLKRFDQAKQRIDKAFALLRDTKDYPAKAVTLDEAASTTLLALGDYHAEMGQSKLAAEVYEDLLQKVMAAKPDPERDLRHAAGVASIFGTLGGLRQRNGDAGKGKELLARRLQLWEHWNKKLPNNAYVLRQLDSVRNSN